MIKAKENLEKKSEKITEFRKQLVVYNGKVIVAILQVGLIYVDQRIKKPVNVSLRGRKYLELQPEKSAEFLNR